MTLSFAPRVAVRGPRLLGALGDERSILADALQLISHGPVVTGWNIRAFDLPVMIARSMCHGLRAPWLWSRAIEDRYRGDLCLDLQEATTMRGAGRSAGMGAFARMLGWPGKVDCDGGDVATMWACGERERVGRYNLTDVAQEAAILTRLLFCRGEIDAQVHDAAAEMLLGAVESMPELAALRGRVDLGRWRRPVDGHVTIAAGAPA